MKMKVFLILIWLTFFLVTKLAYTDTPIMGFISQDTTWTKANSPYITIGNVVVKGGATLTIEPGVTIKFGPKHSLTINGLLVARGTVVQTINFVPKESEKPIFWKGVVFENGGVSAEIDEAGNYLDGSILEYCVVKGAESAVEANYVSPYIDHCVIRGNGSGISISYDKFRVKSGLSRSSTAIPEYFRQELQGKGVFLSQDATASVDATLENTWCITDNGKKSTVSFVSGKGRIFYPYRESIAIRNSSIENCTNSGVVINRGGSVFLVGNTIKENGPGVHISRCHTVTFSGNSITGNQRLGVYFSEGTNIAITNNEISGNTISSPRAPRYGGGIHIETSTNIAITNNTISSNSGGIYLAGVTHVVIKDNLISGNAVGRAGAGLFLEYGKVDVAISGNRIIGNVANVAKSRGFGSLISGGGGGLYIGGGRGDIRIHDNTFAENVSYNNGGGILVVGSHDNKGFVMISHNTFAENVAYNGGALYNVADTGSSDLTIIHNNIFTGNTAQNDGGGIYTSVRYSSSEYWFRSRTVVSTNTFAGNSAENNGGGIIVRFGRTRDIRRKRIGVQIIHNSFEENSGRGAALYYKFSRPFYLPPNVYYHEVIKGNFVANNTGDSAVYIYGNPSFARNAIVDNNTTYDLEYRVSKDSKIGLIDLDATGNYWGEASEAEIRLRVHDFFQDNKLAVANIDPVLTNRPSIKEPYLEVLAPSSLIGIVKVGDYADWKATIFNMGNGPLDVSNVALRDGDPNFKVLSLDLPQQISPGCNLEVTVRFTPSSDEGDREDYLCITSNDPTAPEVSVHVKGNRNIR